MSLPLPPGHPDDDAPQRTPPVVPARLVGCDAARVRSLLGRPDRVSRYAEPPLPAAGWTGPVPARATPGRRCECWTYRRMAGHVWAVWMSDARADPSAGTPAPPPPRAWWQRLLGPGTARPAAARATRPAHVPLRDDELVVTDVCCYPPGAVF